MNLPSVLLFCLLVCSYSFGCQTGLCSQPTCPNGYYFNGSTCVQSSPIGFPTIPSPSLPYASNTQSNTNTYVNYQQPQTTYSCPDGYQFNGTDCILLNSNHGRSNNNFAQDLRNQLHNAITGSIGSIVRDTVSTSGVSCPAGSYFNGANCVSSAGNCPTGYNWNGLACVTSQQTMPAPSYTPSYNPVNVNVGGGISYSTVGNSQMLPTYPTATTSINYPTIQPPQYNPTTYIPATPILPPITSTLPNQIYSNQPTISLPSFYPSNYPTCPTGSTWNGNCCNGTGSIVCPVNSQWNNYVCVSNGGVSCNQGMIWNGFSCVYQSNINCPFGSQWNGDSCTTTNLYCPPGCSNSGNGCYPIALPCPQNTYWSGSNCLPTSGECTTGYNWNGNSCVYIGSQIFSCMPGYNWNGLACIQDTFTVQSCQTGYYFNGLHCVYLPPQTVNPTCSTGWYFHPSSACCLQLPINSLRCTANQYWNGNSCGSAFGGQYTCSSGYAWNGMVCVSYPVQFECDIGKYWNGRSCVNTENKCLRICGEGNNYFNGFRCSQLNMNPRGGWSTFATSSDASIVPAGTNTCQKGFFWYPILKSCVIQKV